MIRTGGISDDIICYINYVQYLYTHKQEQFVSISYLQAAMAPVICPNSRISFILAVVCYILSTHR